jgi:hypothetical protein
MTILNTYTLNLSPIAWVVCASSVRSLPSPFHLFVSSPMVTDNYGRSYRIHRQLSPPRHGLDETIIDTSNHPFISFQNGYVKRERIRKPNIGLKSRRTYKQVKRGRQRTHRRRTNHPSYWR